MRKLHLWPPRAAIATALALFTAAASAHPHNYIRVEVAVMIESGAMQGLRYVWRFDRAYLDGLREEYDRNHDGVLSDDELQPWLAASKKTLETFRSFTTARQGSQLLPLGSGTGHRIERTADGIALYFNVPLAKPAIIDTHPIQIDIYDRTFFTEFVLADDQAVKIDGANAGDCRATVAFSPGGEQQKAITAFMKGFGRNEAKLSPAKAITVTCKN